MTMTRHQKEAQAKQIASIKEASWRLYPHTYAKRLSGGKWLAKPHLRHISIAIANAISEGDGRLIIELPPQHGKSKLISHWTPTWFLDLKPQKNVILTSYESDFAAQWGRLVRNEIQRNHEVGAVVTDDSSKASRWNTVEGGGMITSGMDGAITGKSGDLIIIDDPIKNWKQANSAAYREHCKRFFETVLYTRRQPGTTFILLMTRWHEADLANYLLNEHHEEWTEIRLPALAEENDLLGREIDEALWPERYDAETLKKQRQAQPRIFEAMYQQRPTPAEGNIFKRAWFERRWTELPKEFDQIIQTWDLTFGAGDNAAYNVGYTLGLKGADIYVIEECRKKMEFTDQLSAIKAQKNQFSGVGAILIEKAANGAATINMMKNEISGLIPIKVTGSKEDRAQATTFYFEAGNIIFPADDVRPWSAAAIEELISFPNAKYKDRVDALSQGLNWLNKRKVVDFDIPTGMVKESAWAL